MTWTTPHLTSRSPRPAGAVAPDARPSTTRRRLWGTTAGLLLLGWWWRRRSRPRGDDGVPPAVLARPGRVAPVPPVPADGAVATGRAPAGPGRPDGTAPPGRPRLAPVHGGSVRHGEPVMTELALRAGCFVLGRDRAAELRVDHPSVSPRHALLEVEPDGGVRVRDLGALNGVTVDGVPVAAARLHDGNRLDLGEVQLVFRCDPVVDDGGRQGGELGEQPQQRAQGRD